jgi:hypothetical protein
MGTLALRTKGRSETRRIEFAMDRAGSAPRECSCTSDRPDGDYCFRTAAPMSTTNLTLLRPDLIDHARPVHFLTTAITSDRTRPPSYSLPDLVLLAHPQFRADFSRFAAAPPPANLHHAWAALPGFLAGRGRGVQREAVDPPSSKAQA